MTATCGQRLRARGGAARCSHRARRGPGGTLPVSHGTRARGNHANTRKERRVEHRRAAHPTTTTSERGSGVRPRHTPVTLGRFLQREARPRRPAGTAHIFTHNPPRPTAPHKTAAQRAALWRRASVFQCTRTTTPKLTCCRPESALFSCNISDCRRAVAQHISEGSCRKTETDPRTRVGAGSARRVGRVAR